MSDTANPEGGAADNQQPQSTEEQIAALMGDDGEFSDVPVDEGAEEDAPDGDEPDGEPDGDESEADADDDSSDDDSEDDDKPDDSDDEELESFESLDDLAEAAGMTPEDIRALVKSKIKVQGEEREVTLEELEQGHMFEADYRQKTSTLAEERRTFEGEREQAKQILGDSLQNSVNLMQALESELMGGFNAVDWEGLKASDPTQYNLQRGEFAERQQRLDQYKQQLNQQWHENNASQQQEIEAQQQAYLTQQQENLTRLIPDWLDESKAKAGQESIGDYLKTAFEGDLAFTDDEIASVGDARLVALINKAMLFDQGQKKVETVKKKVRKLPKVAKPGAKKAKGEINAEKRAKQKQRLRKTGSVDDAAAMIAESL